MASVTAAVAFSPMISEADERYCQMPYAGEHKVELACVEGPVVVAMRDWLCTAPTAQVSSFDECLERCSRDSCLSLSADLDRALPSSRAVMVPLVPGLLVGLYANVGPKSTFAKGARRAGAGALTLSFREQPMSNHDPQASGPSESLRHLAILVSYP
ncbi:hypothetical protein KC320_g47 [Hortaea werneckii]|nr:hypothetical protein KC320_g47 [Hortaea werneckii]